MGAKQREAQPHNQLKLLWRERESHESRESRARARDHTNSPRPAAAAFHNFMPDARGARSDTKKQKKTKNGNSCRENKQTG
jgi:hypothetical protein